MADQQPCSCEQVSEIVKGYLEVVMETLIEAIEFSQDGKSKKKKKGAEGHSDGGHVRGAYKEFMSGCLKGAKEEGIADPKDRISACASKWKEAKAEAAEKE